MGAGRRRQYVTKLIGRRTSILTNMKGRAGVCFRNEGACKGNSGRHSVYGCYNIAVSLIATGAADCMSRWGRSVYFDGDDLYAQSGYGKRPGSRFREPAPSALRDKGAPTARALNVAWVSRLLQHLG